MSQTSIIIINYNSTQLTNNCLYSIQKADVDKSQINVVVVDNGSSEPFELPADLKKVGWIAVIRSESNLGFTGGNNLGIEYAIEHEHVEYIMLLNNDTVVDKLLFKHLHRHLEENVDCGIVCPKIYFAEGREYFSSSYKSSQLGKVIWFAGGSIDWDNLTAFHRGVDEVDRGQFVTQKEIEFATGCCLLLKREVIEKLGSLEDDYFLYFEDTDLSMRAKQLGYQIQYCDQAKVWHVNAGSSDGAGSIVHEYFQNRNRLIFFFRYGDFKSKINIVRLWFQLVFSENQYNRRAAWHFLFRQWGKQPIV